MIKITRTAPAEPTSETAWPIGFAAVWTVDNTAAPIFVMQKRAGDLSVDDFSCVASEIQMRDLPVDDPLEDSPFFRVAAFDVILRNENAVLEFQQSLLDAVQELVDERTAAATLDAVTEFTILPS